MDEFHNLSWTVEFEIKFFAAAHPVKSQAVNLSMEK